MRFEALELERYGAFEQRGLKLGGKAPLTVIYGPNEAGKSTSLAAVKDFLFGVPVQTPRMAVFGGDAIKLTATLTRADGKLLTLRRRKGRARTLTDANGVPVEDSVLAALLGSTTRDRFETLFGLDHETLRRGGAQLLTAEGEIGRLIIEAGGGLRGLVQRLERVDAQLDKLFSVRRSAERAFYKALDAYDAAERSVKAGAVTWEQYERARQAHEAAAREVTRLREEKSALVLAVSRLERLVRVVPTLRALDHTRAEIAELTDKDDLPEGFEDAVASAREARQAALDAARAATVRQSGLEDRLQALPVDPTLEALDMEVRDIRERTVHVAKQRDDRPNRLRELADAEAKLQGLRRRLALSPQDDLAPRLPAMAVIERVRALAGQAQRREAELAAARRDLAQLEAASRRLKEAVQAAAAQGQGQGAGVAVADLAGLPSALQALTSRRNQAERSLQDAQKGLHALGFADLAAARVETFPTAEAVGEEMAADEKLRAERLAQCKARADAEAERDRGAREVARLTAGSGVASDEALQAAREARSEALAPLRAAHLAGAWPKSPEARADEVQGADVAVTRADELADRHAAEAHRAAELAQASRQRDEAVALAAAAEKAVGDVEVELTRRAAAFRAAFPAAASRFPELAGLKAAAARREALLEAAAAARAILDDTETEQAGLAAQSQLLDLAERTCGLAPAIDASVADRVRQALTALTRHEAAFAECQRSRQALAETETSIAGARDTLRSLEAAEATWRAAWLPALEALGLTHDGEIDEAAAAAMEWASAAGVLTAIETTKRRLARMDQDETELKARVTEVVAKIGLRTPEDVVVAAGMLQDRWEAQTGARRQREALDPELKSVRREVGTHESMATDAAAEIERLAGLAGVEPADTAALDEICARLTERRRLRGEERRLVESLKAPGDGLPEAELRAAWAARDLDALKADLTMDQERTHALDGELETAIELAVAARNALEAHHEQAGVNAAVVAREAAVAELHDVVERYVELALARDLIKDAIAQVRARQQDPLVARAGELFAAMTRGDYTGVAADIDAKGEPVVVGVDRQRRTVAVPQMSDGSRDQLYLAFRLAGLESYCKAAEPLPFVADDILVHFDDLRTEATLEVLADFCGVTQVLLFTHHLSVRRAAEALAAKGKAEVIELA